MHQCSLALSVSAKPYNIEPCIRKLLIGLGLVEHLPSVYVIGECQPLWKGGWDEREGGERGQGQMRVKKEKETMVGIPKEKLRRGWSSRNWMERETVQGKERFSDLQALSCLEGKSVPRPKVTGASRSVQGILCGSGLGSLSLSVKELKIGEKSSTAGSIRGNLRHNQSMENTY